MRQSIFLQLCFFGVILADFVKYDHIEKALRSQDAERTNFLLQTVPTKCAKNFQCIKDRFHRISSQPLVNGCKVSKLIGGQWLSPCGALDGAKVVCMDKFLETARLGKCLVYSFGIADDWSFEEALADLGCKVRAFDPTIEIPEKKHENVTFHLIGIAHKTMAESLIDDKIVPVKTLEDFRKMFKEEDKEITYLKLDVEGYEIKMMPQWAKSGALKNVQQIGVELHTEQNLSASTYLKLIQTYQSFYRDGFRMISYSPNVCIEKYLDADKKYHTHFDLLFVRQ